MSGKLNALLEPPLVCPNSKVVRRVSVNERSSLYRREHHKEAMVWQERGRQPEPHDDDEDRQTDNELNQQAAMVGKLSVLDVYNTNVNVLLSALLLLQGAAGGASGCSEELQGRAADRKIVSHLGNGGTSVSLASSVPGELWSGGRMDRSASYQLTPAASGSGSGSVEGEGADSMTREKSRHTLADLKRQRAAAKLNKYPAPPPPLASPLEEDPSVSTAEQTAGHAQPNLQLTPKDEVVASASQVYFTPASGDPPLLKLRAPEEEQSSNKEPCCGLM